MMKDDDFKLLRGFADRQTNERTNEQTFVNVESLSRLKIILRTLGTKKNIRLFGKILSKWTLLYSKSSNFLEFS